MASKIEIEVQRIANELAQVLGKKLPDDAVATIISQDNVGNGCWCIYPFEKHYIKLLFNDEIERVESDNKKLLEWEPLDEEKKLSPEQVSRFKEMNKAAVEGVRRTYLRDLKTVLERFEKMPDCR